jgi:hypothetical protein
LEANKIRTDDNRLSHILMYAELDGLICSGQIKGSRQSYSLLDEVVPDALHLTKDESLYRLAKKYFESHAPATLSDFAWWSGLYSRDVKLAMELIKQDFISEIVDNQTYWLPNSHSNIKIQGEFVTLLPAYDEYLISYKDRRHSLSAKHQIKAVSNNGIFRPVIILNGEVIGLWKKVVKKDSIAIEHELFGKYSKSIIELINQRAREYVEFLNSKLFVS